MRRKSVLKKTLGTIGIYLLILALAVTGTISAKQAASANPAYKDLPASHWASIAIGNMTNYGVLSGYTDGTVRPNQPITRVEFAAMINRLFGFHKLSKALINDVADGSWARTEMAKAIAAGYLSLSQDHSAEPNRTMSRGEVAVAITELFHLSPPSLQSMNKFKDIAELNEAMSKAITTLAQSGYVNGFVDGTFKPAKTITRAELAALLDRLTELYLNKEGTVSAGTVQRNVLINHTNVVLNNTTIEGNLILTTGIGEGDAQLDNVTVIGTTYVQGGGQHSITIRNSHLANLVVNKSDSPVRVIISGTVDQLTIAEPADLILEEGATVNKLIITAQAGHSTIENKGKIGAVDNQATGVMINGKALQSGDADGNMITGGNSGGVTAGGGGGGNGGGGGGQTITDPWTLVWSDEFDDNTIDPAKWTFDTTNGASVGNPGWGNNELEYYTSRPENVKEENGNLILTARKEEYEGFHYTSGRIKTKGLFSKKYGKFEIRAKTPAGKGYWPAIWMLPEDNVYGTWAASGEIDIMETWGSRPNTVAGTIHYGQQWPGNTYSGKEYEFTNSTTQQFHTYALEWEPNEIRWYVDGHLYSTKNDWYSQSANQPAVNSYPAPFDQAFHLLMNVAVGGHFDGDPTPETVFPQTMEVDYVRVYELTGRSYNEPVPLSIPKEEYLPGSNLPQAPDNDLVYNANFTQEAPGDAGMGINGTAHWSLFQEPGGAAATVAIEKIGASNYAKVSISNSGSNPYSIQPQAIVSLAKGRNYKLTFDARTDTAREMNVKLTGGQSRGFAAYSPSLSVPLSSEFKSFEMSFQMKQNSDAAARIEFNMGTNTQPVWFGNVKLVELDSLPFEHDAPKIPYGPDGNHIYNGTFDQGEPNRLSYWHLSTSNGAQASAAVDAMDRKLRILSLNGGAAADDVQFSQKGLSLIQGQHYLLTVDGAANPARNVSVLLQNKDGTVIHAEQTLNLSSNIEAKSMTFVYNGATTADNQLVMKVGGSTGELIMDNIKLVRTSRYLDPSIVQFPLINGQFDGGLSAWQSVANDGAAITPSVQQSEAKLSIGATGVNPWSALFFQEGLQTASGVQYVVGFDAYATANRKIQAVIENASYQRSFDQIVELTPTKKRYTFEFVKSGTETVGLKFLLGQIAGDPQLGAHDIWIDNVVFEPKEAIGLNNRIVNGTFDVDSYGWTNFFAQDIGVTGAVYGEGGKLKASLNRSGPDSWNAQVDYENILIENNKSYRLTFDAHSSIDRNIQLVVEHKGGDYTKYLEPLTVALTNEAQTFSYTFTSKSPTDAGAHINFMLGRIDQEISIAHAVYFDNVSFIEVTMPSIEGHGLLNGTFDSSTDNWTLAKTDGSNADMNVDGQKLRIDFPNYDGWFPWSTLLSQGNLKLEDGKTYVLQFEASSSLAKNIQVEILKGSSGQHLIAQPVVLSAPGNIFTYEFTVSGGTDQSAKLNFLLGSINIPGAPPSPDYAGPLFQSHSIWLDTITLTVKP